MRRAVLKFRILFQEKLRFYSAISVCTSGYFRTIDAFPWGAGHGTLRRHAQVSRQAMHYAHKGINALMSCDKAFQNPCHSAKRERKYVQQHIRICTHGVKTGLR